MKEGSDIGCYDTVLSKYELQAKANAYSMTLIIDALKNSYEDRILGSNLLGSALAHVWNTALEIIDSSSFIKHNMTTFASGSFTHPKWYEWESMY